MLTNRTHFARMLTAAQLKETVAMLQSVCDQPLAELSIGSLDTGALTIRAPDGDIVLQTLKKAPNVWITRLHREVFSE